MLNDFFTAILICAGAIILFALLTPVALVLTFLGLIFLFWIFELLPTLIFFALTPLLFLSAIQYFRKKARKIHFSNPRIYPRNYSRELSWPWRKYL